MSEARERPIIFSAPMVRAILEGRKTQTRRVTKPQPNIPASGHPVAQGELLRDWLRSYACPYGKPGDRLWVREGFTWVTLAEIDSWDTGVFSEIKRVPKDYKHDHAGSKVGMLYRATDTNWEKHAPWTSPVHMPRWASRITLEIVDVRIERLQEIKHGDIIAELGANNYANLDTGHRDNFIELWDSINGKKHPWSNNPWVWVVEFKKI